MQCAAPRLNVARLSACMATLALVPVMVILYVPASTPDEYAVALLLLALVATAHELLHLVAARLLRVPVRLVFLKRYLLPGIKLVGNTSCSRCAVVVLTPQILTGVLAVCYVATGYTPLLYVLVTHIAVSVIDIVIAAWLLAHRREHILVKTSG